MAVEAPLFALFLGETSVALLYSVSTSVAVSMPLLQSAAVGITSFFERPPGSFIGKTMAVILTVLLGSSMTQVFKLQVRDKLHTRYAEKNLLHNMTVENANALESFIHTHDNVHSVSRTFLVIKCVTNYFHDWEYL